MNKGEIVFIKAKLLNVDDSERPYEVQDINGYWPSVWLSKEDVFPIDQQKLIAELEEYADKLAAGLPDGILPKDVEVLREANTGMSTGINKAVDLILEFGFIDGGHHKQWLLDQVLRVLLGEGYQDRIAEYNEPEDYFDWDTGIAP